MKDYGRFLLTKHIRVACMSHVILLNSISAYRQNLILKRCQTVCDLDVKLFSKWIKNFSENLYLRWTKSFLSFCNEMHQVMHFYYFALDWVLCNIWKGCRWWGACCFMWHDSHHMLLVNILIFNIDVHTLQVVYDTHNNIFLNK